MIYEAVKRMIEGWSVYVLLRAMHRVEKFSKERMVLIEQQIGTCLGEDNITRHEDVYERN